MNIYTVLATIPIALVLLTGTGFGQSKRCGSFDKKVTYKILTDNITTKDSNREIFLQIYVEPERFTVGSMVKLMERIKREYCEFDSIAVSIFDTKKREKMPDPLPQPLGEWLLMDREGKIRPRGFYEYDKQASTAELTFQEKRNNKEIDVEIIFRPDGYCVSETNTKPSERK